MTLDATNLLSRLVGPTAAASGTSTLFTGVAGHVYTFRKIRIANTDASNTKTVQLFINGSAAANAITSVLTVRSGGYLDFDEFLVLSGTDTLQITTSATGLTVSAYGLDQS